MKWPLTVAALLIAGGPLPAQIPASGKFVGTVREFSAATAEILIQPDGAETARVKVGPDTEVQRVGPGEKDLRNAAAIPVTALEVGDRVYVTLQPGTSEARRIVVMSAAEIEKRKDADRQDWIARGVSGIVTARTAGSITLRMPSMGAERTAIIWADGKTQFRRYAPDSVRFADAKPSHIGEVSPGDQVRARGEKSADGLTLRGEEIVFGTFQTRAGSIQAVDAANREITITEAGTNRQVTIRLTADSQLKKMPDFGAMMDGPMPGGAPPGGPPGGGPSDLSQMLEHLPAASLEDLKPGSSIIVSSTKGQSDTTLTAIMLLANADMLIRMASTQSGPGRRPGRGMQSEGMGAGMGGFGGLSEIYLSGMMMP
jgi:hypothetical protein